MTMSDKAVEIRVVETKKQLREFVKIPFALYRKHPLWVPPLIRDELRQFDPRRNPAYETAETKLFIAYQNGQAVGRIAGILSHIANAVHHSKNLRFGWFDTIKDYEVAQALFGAVEEWGAQRGMETLTGPQGFSDLDPQGMLIDGFEFLPTVAVIYNYPYYPAFVEQYGFKKEVDFVEFLSVVPMESGIPLRLQQTGEQIRNRNLIHLVKFKNRRHVLSRVQELFHLLQETFKDVYGSVPLTPKQMAYYIQKYISFADPHLIQMVVDEHDEAIGFLIALPSLSTGFQKARGHLFPFGWYHIKKSLQSYLVLDFYLAGVKEKFRGHGVDLLMVLEVLELALQRGAHFAESNPEIETNKKVHAQWKYFNPTPHKRRRIFKKEIALHQQ